MKVVVPVKSVLELVGLLWEARMYEHMYDKATTVRLCGGRTYCTDKIDHSILL